MVDRYEQARCDEQRAFSLSPLAERARDIVGLHFVQPNLRARFVGYEARFVVHALLAG